LYLYAPIVNGKSVKLSWKPYPGATDYSLKLAGNNSWANSWTTKGIQSVIDLEPGSYELFIFVFGPACTQGMVNFTVP
jgi:hypothetical protein